MKIQTSSTVTPKSLNGFITWIATSNKAFKTVMQIKDGTILFTLGSMLASNLYAASTTYGNQYQEVFIILSIVFGILFGLKIRQTIKRIKLKRKGIDLYAGANLINYSKIMIDPTARINHYTNEAQHENKNETITTPPKQQIKD